MGYGACAETPSSDTAASGAHASRPPWPAVTPTIPSGCGVENGGLLAAWVTRVHPASCFLRAPVAGAGIHKNRSECLPASCDHLCLGRGSRCDLGGCTELCWDLCGECGAEEMERRLTFWSLELRLDSATCHYPKSLLTTAAPVTTAAISALSATAH
nr:uncharacterized protein LOC123567127 isoform X2 [Macaca fascicularis]